MKVRFRVLSAMVGILLVSGCDNGTEPDLKPEAEMIGAEGGVLVLGDLTLEVPPGALTQPTAITIEEVSPGAAPAGFLTVDGKVFDLGPDGLSFREPFVLTIRYNASSLPSGVGESELGIIHLDGSGEVLPSTVDRAAGTVRATADHFSSFGLGLEVGTLQRVACPALVPEALNGIPLDRIAIGQLPTSFQPPFAAFVEGLDGEPTSLAPVYVDADGNAELVTPIHPSTSPAGGAVRMNVSDGVRACAAFDFTVEPLPPAPGELSAIADQLQLILAAQAAELETSPAELISTPVDQLPRVLIPLALLQSTLDHPDNNRSFRAIADGTAPDAGANRLDLMEPLLARTGLRAALAASVASGPVAAPGGPAGVSAMLCQPEAIGSDAGLLDACMRSAASAQFRIDGASGKVLSDMGQAFTVAGLVPGLGAPAAVAGFASWLVLNEKARTAALLPSALTTFTVDHAPGDFLEDEDGPGAWSNAQLSATNKGWDMGKEGLEALLGGAGAVGAVGGFDNLGGPPMDGLLAGIVTGPVAAQILAGGTVDAFKIEPETFGPVSVTAQEWTESDMAGTAAVLLSRTEYDPREPGSATLTVRTKQGSFGGQVAEWETDIRVDQLDLDISPEDISLAPGEPQGFTVTVQSSEHPEMVEVVDPGALQGTVGDITYIGDGVHIVDYTAPLAPDPASPDLLTVRHTAVTGARGYATEERVAVATIRFGSITVTPATACLEPGEILQFQAEVEGLMDDGVEWSADAGAIDPSTGRYTAPASAPPGGFAVITARSTTVSAVTGEATIQIGGCSCQWSVLVDGRSVQSEEMDGASFQLLESSLVSLGLGDEGAGQSVSFNIDGDTGVSVGATGAFGVFVFGDLGISSGDLFYSTSSHPLATLTLTENDGTVVGGSITGMVDVTSMTPDVVEPRPTSFNASFRIVSDGAPQESEGLVIHFCTVEAGPAGDR